MYEFVGMQRVSYKRLLDIAQKTTWDTGRELLEVNRGYSQHDSYDDMIRDLTQRFRRKAYVTIPEFMEVLAQAIFGSSSSWGDKTPDYGFYMGVIHKLWPSCKFIHIVRGGLETGRSMSKHSGCQLMISGGYDNWCSLSYDRLYEKYERRVLPLKAYVSSWRRRLARIRDEARSIPEKFYIECSYEQLVKDPVTVLRRTARFLQVDADDHWLDYAVGKVRRGHRHNPLSAVEIALLGPENVIAVSSGFASATTAGSETPSNSSQMFGKSINVEQGPESQMRTAISNFAAAHAAGRAAVAHDAVVSIIRELERSGFSTEADSWKAFGGEAKSC